MLRRLRAAVQHVPVRLDPLDRPVRQLVPEPDRRRGRLVDVRIDPDRVVRVVLVQRIEHRELHGLLRQPPTERVHVVRLLRRDEVAVGKGLLEPPQHPLHPRPAIGEPPADRQHHAVAGGHAGLQHRLRAGRLGGHGLGDRAVEIERRADLLRPLAAAGVEGHGQPQQGVVRREAPVQHHRARPRPVRRGHPGADEPVAHRPLRGPDDAPAVQRPPVELQRRIRRAVGVAVVQRVLLGPRRPGPVPAPVRRRARVHVLDADLDIRPPAEVGPHRGPICIARSLHGPLPPLRSARRSRSDSLYS